MLFLSWVLILPIWTCTTTATLIDSKTQYNKFLNNIHNLSYKTPERYELTYKFGKQHLKTLIRLQGKSIDLVNSKKIPINDYIIKLTSLNRPPNTNNYVHTFHSQNQNFSFNVNKINTDLYFNSTNLLTHLERRDSYRLYNLPVNNPWNRSELGIYNNQFYWIKSVREGLIEVDFSYCIESMKGGYRTLDFFTQFFLLNLNNLIKIRYHPWVVLENVLEPNVLGIYTKFLDFDTLINILLFI